MKAPLPGLGGQMPPKRDVIELHPAMPGEAGRIAQAIKAIVGKSLHKHTKRCAKDMKTTGASVVFISITHFWDELREVNPTATADYFRALADLIEAPDPDSAMNAEQRRKDARASLLASLEAENV